MSNNVSLLYQAAIRTPLEPDAFGTLPIAWQLFFDQAAAEIDSLSGANTSSGNGNTTIIFTAAQNYGQQIEDLAKKLKYVALGQATGQSIAVGGLQVAMNAMVQANLAQSYAYLANFLATAAMTRAVSGANTAAVYEAGNLILANAQLNLTNTVSINLAAQANGVNANITATINSTLNLVSLNISSNLVTGNSVVLGTENVATLNVSNSIADMGFLLVRGTLPSIGTMNSQAGGITLGSQVSSGVTQAIEMFAANSGTDNGWWEIIVSNNSPQFIMRTANDNYNNISNFMRVTRANSNIVAIILGNSQDLPTITLNGNAAVTQNLTANNLTAFTLANTSTLNVSGLANVTTLNVGVANCAVVNATTALISMGDLIIRGGLPGTGTINTGGIILGNQILGNTQCMEIFTANSGVDNGWWEVVATNNGILQFRTANDTYGNVVTWLKVTRSKVNITSIQIGDIVDNPKTTFLGNVTIQRPSGAGQGLQDLSITDGTHTALFGSNSTQGAWNPLGQGNDSILMAANSVINTGVLTLIPWSSNAAGIRISNNNITLITDGGEGTFNINTAMVNVNSSMVINGAFNSTGTINTTSNIAAGNLVVTTLANIALLNLTTVNVTTSNVATENAGVLNVSTSIVDQGWFQVRGNFPGTSSINLASGAITIGNENSGNDQAMEFFVANAGVDQGWWEVIATNTAHFIMRTANDTYGNIANWLVVGRANSNVTFITLGNPQDLPTLYVNGAMNIQSSLNVVSNLSVGSTANVATLNISTSLVSGGAALFYGQLPALRTSANGIWIGTEATANNLFIDMKLANTPAANVSLWEFTANNNNSWTARITSDDYSGFANWLAVTRTVSGLGGNVNVAAITLGNPVDYPTYQFYSNNILQRATGGTSFYQVSNSSTPNSQTWLMQVGGGGAGTFGMMAANDSLASVARWVQVTRSIGVGNSANISSITIGNAQDNPPLLLNANVHINAGANTGRPLTIDCYANTQGLTINNTSNTVGGGIQWANALSQRWSIATSHTPETGSNVGTDLGFFSYSDTGSFIGEPITITRATGNVAFSGNVNVTTNLSALTANITVLNVSSEAVNNISAGNLSTTNLVVTSISNLAITNISGLVSPNTSTYANGGLIVASANQNFNNSATIIVAITANGSQANIALTANITAIAGPAYNAANQALAYVYLANSLAEAAFLKANSIAYSNLTLTSLNVSSNNASVNGVSFTPSWTAPTVNASYTTVTGYNPAGYWRDPFGIVHLRGTLKPATNTLVSAALNVNVCNGFPLATANNVLECIGANATTVGTNTTTMFQAVLYTNGAIQLTGDVSPVAGNLVFFSLDGETYSSIG